MRSARIWLAKELRRWSEALVPDGEILTSEERENTVNRMRRLAVAADIVASMQMRIANDPYPIAGDRERPRP